MMISTKIRNIFLIMGLLCAFTACVEDLYKINDIPEGESTVKVEIGFKDFTPALTRSAGDAIKKINTLWVVIYHTDGTLYRSERVTNFQPGDTESNERPDGKPSSETTTGHASFNLTLPNGRYRIYAVANMDLSGRDVSSEANLRNLSIDWDENDVTKNAEMFGWFVNGDKTTSRPDGFEASIVEIRSGYSTLHAWMKRAASKITVAYDGTRLKPGVSISIKSVTIKDIPAHCLIGESNHPGSIDYPITTGNAPLIASGEKVVYEGDALVTNELPHYPRVRNEDGTGWVEDPATHSDGAASTLFFYENMQGNYEGQTQYDKRQQRKTDNSNELVYENKDNVPYGTYVEVEAYYRAIDDDNKESHGPIKYRFMLGKDITYDYDAERNHHYKLTLIFNGKANDYDWHIDYREQIFEVTDPAIFDYQGKIFNPDDSREYTNRGHNFSDESRIEVVSYYDNDPTTFNDCTISYLDEEEHSDYSESCSWLECSGPQEVAGDPKKRAYTFKVPTSQLTPTDEFTIDNKFKSFAGSEESPCNLADGGKITSTIEDTANCYIVDASGWYMLPLVYGNAITGGKDYSESYNPGGSGNNNLTTFKNHLGNSITSPYITENIGGNEPHSAGLVWQDEQSLVDNIKYVPGLYGNKGGIKFRINNAKQGNAVIALKNSEGEAIWSWHIWVTPLMSYLKGFNDETIQVITNQYNDATEKYDFMPMNLGWCSEHNDNVKFYKGRKCKVKFKCGELEQVVEIKKASHLALTRGNNPYYQWGRKDPFWGTTLNWGNKQWYDAAGNSHGPWSENNGFGGDKNNPERFFSDTYNSSEVNENERKTTQEMLAEMIKHPNKWHNPPRKSIVSGGTKSYLSMNKTYSNLWGNGWSEGVVFIKSVYDPCPVGYMVPHYNAFSGFAVLDKSNPALWILNHDTDDTKWFDVKKAKTGQTNDPTDNLYEFYTNPNKYQSIIFPETGYRDWDDQAKVFLFGDTGNAEGGVGYVWSRIASNHSAGNGDDSSDKDAAFNFEFSRSPVRIKGIRPTNAFYTCNGLPVRPVRCP